MSLKQLIDVNDDPIEVEQLAQMVRDLDAEIEALHKPEHKDSQEK